MAVYGPGCHPQNIIWTEAKLKFIYYFVGDRPVYKLPFGTKCHELFVILYSIHANLSDDMFFFIVYLRQKTSSDKIRKKTLYWSGPVNIYRLIHGHFHIGLVIIPRPPHWPETESRANMGRGMITRPIWKCPCIKLFITYFRHLEKRHPYWPETKSRPILARANMSLDMEMIL